MSALHELAGERTASAAVREELVALIAGGLFTLVLFLGLARLENLGPKPSSPTVEDLRMVSLPIEPPPPRPTVMPPPEPQEMALPLAGIDAGPSDSAVSIAVLPPDLESLLPITAAPKAAVSFNLRHAEFKPKAAPDSDPRHVFQESEVDQKPRAVVRTVPVIPAEVSSTASTLRVLLLLQINEAGKAESARILQSSGNAKFDEILARTIREEWVFSPAVRRGKKVKVLAQQAFRINFDNGASPFTVDR